MAPSNVAMQHLTRKPWEDEEESIGSGPSDEERRAMDNIRKFVMSHIISTGRLSEPGEHKNCESGFELWYEEVSGNKYVYSTKSKTVKAEVLKSKGVGNGEVWTLDGILN